MTADIQALHTLDAQLELKTTGDGGYFEGYAAVFGNVDRDGDVVMKGAFQQSLKIRTPVLLWQHSAKDPIGRFDVVREDDKGLFVRGRLTMTGRGLEAYELMKMGALTGLSIGFVTREARRDPVTGVRTITRADLMEVSLVTFPANELARVETVKADAITTERQFEVFLRDNGFSRRRAKVITAQGFKAEQGFKTEQGFKAEVGLAQKNDAGVIQEMITRLQRNSSYDLEIKASSQRVVLGPNSKRTFSFLQNGGRSWESNSNRAKVFVIPRLNGAKFTCKVEYTYFTKTGPKYMTEYLSHFREARMVEFGATSFKDLPQSFFNKRWTVTFDLENEGSEEMEFELGFVYS